MSKPEPGHSLVRPAPASGTAAATLRQDRATRNAKTQAAAVKFGLARQPVSHASKRTGQPGAARR
jgi:hypothetical protein